MPAVSVEAELALPPDEALELWLDTDRWPTFVEGFARVIDRSQDWPAEGARVVWESNPAGRGRVTEKIVERSPGGVRFSVFEERLAGEQTARFVDGRVALRLEYSLARGGPLSGLTDVLFIRRAVRDMLRRTAVRFAVEAEDQAGLR